ncbi:glycosyl hydrolases family 18-domain-containing protein [Coprinopsis sp. MPI-PUGE-AT-0042]|nr:glycosyl hydrolases family 18-domain-containing protein [Coprinopsis sp. MPI-PUGE-AT-0042]
MAPPTSLWRFVSVALVLLNSLLAVESTQIMRRPATYKNKPNEFAMESHPKLNSIERRAANGKANFAYFTNWGIYGANFQPTDIVADPVTHILYSFADTDSSSGAIKLTDSYADEQKRYPGDTWDEVGNNLYGCLKQLYLLKMKKRDLKVLLSIGGWTYSQSGHFNFVTNSGARAKFVSDAIQLIEDYGFDGIDIDYEYPSTTAQGQGLADLMTSLRTALTQLQSRKGDRVPYLLTAAVGAGPTGYTYLNIPQMDQAMDFWNLMAYDYAGSWLTFADHQANFYGGERTGFSTDKALKFYTSKGATPSKINLGMPLYGRAFENTAGLGQPYSGIGPGTIEAGIYSYKALPLAGAQVYENRTDMTSFSYDSAKREWVSYDTPNVIRQKAKYVQDNNLAGSMFWEMSTDKRGSDSLIAAAASQYPGGLDKTQNHISYPNSKFDNLRKNMGGSTPGNPTTTTGPTPTGGTGCGGVAAWSPTTVYVGGQTASYNGRLWAALWWTQNEVPGGASGVWSDKGPC